MSEAAPRHFSFFGVAAPSKTPRFPQRHDAAEERFGFSAKTTNSRFSCVSEGGPEVFQRGNKLAKSLIRKMGKAHVNKKHTLRWLVVAIALVTVGAVTGPTMVSALPLTPGGAVFCPGTGLEAIYRCPDDSYKVGLLGSNGKEAGPGKGGRKCCFKKDPSKRNSGNCKKAHSSLQGCESKKATIFSKNVSDPREKAYCDYAKVDVAFACE